MAIELQFTDLKNKTKFKTNKYKVVRKFVKGITRKYAVAKVPNESYEAWRVLPKDFKE